MSPYDQLMYLQKNGFSHVQFEKIDKIDKKNNYMNYFLVENKNQYMI